MGGSVRMLLWVGCWAAQASSSRWKLHSLPRQSQNAHQVPTWAADLGALGHFRSFSPTSTMCSDEAEMLAAADRVLLLKNQQRARNRAPDSIPSAFDPTGGAVHVPTSLPGRLNNQTEIPIYPVMDVCRCHGRRRSVSGVPVQCCISTRPSPSRRPLTTGPGHETEVSITLTHHPSPSSH